MQVQAYVSQHGSLLCLGHMIAYHSRRRRDVHVQDMETDGDVSINVTITQAVKHMGI